MKRVFVYLLIVLLLLSGCSSEKSEAYGEVTVSEPKEAMKEEAQQNGDSLETYPVGRKIIINADVTLRVLNYADAAQSIEDATVGVGGYVSNSSLNESHGYLVLKIPVGHAKGFITSLGNFGHIIESSSSSQDVTDDFMDLEIRIKNLELQIETLRSLLLKDDIKIEEIFKIENEIRRLVNEMEGYKGQLRSLDASVSFSEIRISLTKEAVVSATVTEDFAYQLKATFQSGVKVLLNFIQGIILAVAFVVPLSPVVIVVVGIAYIVYKKQKPKTKK